jgi:hypothetical protein
MGKRYLILMTPGNLVKCENGTKTNTRRTSERLAGIKTGDEIYFRSNYKTTYKTASGPYLATDDARWENIQDISDGDVAAEGVNWAEPLLIGRPDNGCKSPAQRAMKLLWDSIYAKKPGESWADNPRVLRIAFKKL